MLEPVALESTAAEGRKRRPAIVLAILWMLMAGLIHLLLLRTRSEGARNAIGITAAVLAGVALFACFRDSFLGPRRSTPALLLLITCALIVALVVWNILFHRYIRVSGYTEDNFRRVYHTLHAPLYGMREKYLPWFLIWPMLATSAALAFVIAFRNRLAAGRISAWWFVLLQLVLMVGFSLSDGTRHLGPQPPQRFVASAGISAPQSSRELLHDWVGNMPSHTGRFAHYPPGFALWRQVVLKNLRIEQWRYYVTMLLVCLTPLPLAALARELGMERGAAQLGLLLFATAIGVLVYQRTDFAMPAIPLAALSLWLLVRGAKTGQWWPAVLLGVVFAAFVMFVFTSVIVALVMALIIAGGVWTGSISARNAAKTVGVSALVFIAIFIALYAWSGFNIYECFQTARANERSEHGSGFDDPSRYLLRSSGHVLAYLVGSGFALAGFALMSLGALRGGRSSDRLAGVAAWALLAGIVFAGFSGAFHGETERVWLVFTPLLAVVAGWEWYRRTAREGPALLVGVMLVVLLGNCAQELLYKHQSRSVRREANRQRAVQMEEEAAEDPPPAK